MKKKFIPIAAFFITLTSFGCSHEGSGFLDKFLKGGGSTVPVTVENVLVRDRSYKIKVPAVLKPSEEVKVTMPDEVTIKRVFIAKGDAVKRVTRYFKYPKRPTHRYSRNTARNLRMHARRWKRTATSIITAIGCSRRAGSTRTSTTTWRWNSIRTRQRLRNCRPR